jgi:hypothetical protein
LNVPSFDSAPAVVHSGAGAGELGAARSTRTHATLEGAGGAWFGVMTWPIATYPGGGFGRQTATVPVEKKHGVILIAHTRSNKINSPVRGFFLSLEPESPYTRSNPTAGATGERQSEGDTSASNRPPPDRSSHGAYATNASPGALNEGTTAVPRGTHPGGHTGSHADIWRLLAVVGQWLGGTIWVVLGYLSMGGRLFSGRRDSYLAR